MSRGAPPEDPTSWRSLAEINSFPVYVLAHPTAKMVNGCQSMFGSDTSGYFELRFSLSDEKFIIVRTYHLPRGNAFQVREEGVQRELMELLIHFATVQRRPVMPLNLSMEHFEETISIDGKPTGFTGISLTETSLKVVSATLTDQTAVLLLGDGIVSDTALWVYAKDR